MNKALFLLCPTDCLETTVNNTFEYENYFYTSLGNSFALDSKTLISIKEFIIKHNIKQIHFVLSNDNPIISDALEGQFFSEMTGLKKLYEEIKIQKENSEILWSTLDNQFLILSYFLNVKIKELQIKLSYILDYFVEISGKIYNRQEDRFIQIQSALTCLEKQHLN